MPPVSEKGEHSIPQNVNKDTSGQDLMIEAPVLDGTTRQ